MKYSAICFFDGLERHDRISRSIHRRSATIAREKKFYVKLAVDKSSWSCDYITLHASALSRATFFPFSQFTAALLTRD